VLFVSGWVLFVSWLSQSDVRGSRHPGSREHRHWEISTEEDAAVNHAITHVFKDRDV
jgi:hypothetical protein